MNHDFCSRAPSPIVTEIVGGGIAIQIQLIHSNSFLGLNPTFSCILDYPSNNPLLIHSCCVIIFVLGSALPSGNPT